MRVGGLRRSVRVDITRWPTVLVTEGGEVSVEERDQTVVTLLALLERGRHGLVLDLAKGQPLPESARERIRAQLRPHAGELQQKWAAVGIVLSMPLLTHLPSGAFWMQVASVPARVFTDLPAALRWVGDHLQERSTGTISLLPDVRSAAQKRRR